MAPWRRPGSGSSPRPRTAIEPGRQTVDDPKPPVHRRVGTAMVGLIWKAWDWLTSLGRPADPDRPTPPVSQHGKPD